MHGISRIGNSIETESRLVVAVPGTKEKWGVTACWYGVLLGGDENVWEFHRSELPNFTEVVVVQYYECAKCH